MSHNHRYHQAKSVTLIGAGVNIILGLVKVLGGIFFYSHALLADGVHSFSDLFTDGMVLFASKYGSQDADDAHPYGHQRIETATTLLLALLLILAGVGIAWDSMQHLWHRTAVIPSMLALPIALFSIVANEALFYLTRRVGQRINSSLVLANAWHHRSDSAASFIVLMGIIGSLFGFSYLDPIAAIVVGCLIIKMGVTYGWDSVKELVDTGVSSDQVAEIMRNIHDIDGVAKVHQLRNRKMGSDLFIDVHVLVLPWISVSEGHQIAQRVHATLMSSMSAVKDVTVHIDPEDDELGSPSGGLPSRLMLEDAFFNGWSKLFPEIETYIVHYLDGKLSIDIQLNEPFDNWAILQKTIQDDLLEQKNIGTIRYFLKKGNVT